MVDLVVVTLLQDINSHGWNLCENRPDQLISMFGCRM